MNLISITADLSSVCFILRNMNELLLRLVQAVERVSPVLTSPDDAPPVYQAQASDVHTIDDAAQERLRAGAYAFASRYGVVPGSPAFEDAMQNYEEEMRRIYGDGAAVDWEEVFRKAAAD